ncbi:hypothetical protein FACS189485_04090 [Spirochaetia bacterium]|nr:hypothetical protein FACS189485_04090 [Spirochaetia bacterium]
MAKKKEGEKFIFQVQGSAPEPYTVEVKIDPLRISCDCTAGLNCLPCDENVVQALDDMNNALINTIQADEEVESVLQKIREIMR